MHIWSMDGFVWISVKKLENGINQKTMSYFCHPCMVLFGSVSRDRKTAAIRKPCLISVIHVGFCLDQCQEIVKRQQSEDHVFFR